MVMETESKFHVLAVDDSLFDRKMIERLLQKSLCQGRFEKAIIFKLYVLEKEKEDILKKRFLYLVLVLMFCSNYS